MSILSAIVVFAIPSFSQSANRPSNELSVGIGTASFVEFANDFGAGFGAAFTDRTVSDVSTTGAIGVEFMKYLNSHVALGVSLLNETASIKYEDSSSSLRQNYTTIMPTVKLPWFYREHMSMYSKAALGASLGVDLDKDSDSSDSGTELLFAMQLSPIGIDFGGSQLRGFVEAGFGMQGLLLFGMRYAF